ncbi:MAG: DUF1249 domain-containing protein [Pseudomonadales bacterium]|nr:DUF1249 domain-containing protein [Pseudomonadales bacterium]
MTGNRYSHQLKKKYAPNLVGYIGQCELNFCQLNRLLPYLHEKDECTFGVESLVGDGAADRELFQICCQVIERCKYTTTLSLVQDSNLSDWMPKPTLIVRMYHDARMAEVLSFQRNRYLQATYSYPNDKMYQPDEKAQNNAFLGEWLAYCLANGMSLNAVPIPAK